MKNLGSLNQQRAKRYSSNREREKEESRLKTS